MQKLFLNLALVLLSSCCLFSCGDDDDDVRVYGGIKQIGFLSSDFGRYQSSVAVLGTKAYIVGGFTDTAHSLTDKISILDYTLGKTPSDITLNRPRANMVTVSTEQNAFFAGGDGVNGTSKDISILAENGTWRTTSLSLSEARSDFAGACAGNCILFAGGFNDGEYLSSVDIYKINNSYEHTKEEITPRAGLAGVASGNYIFLAGGRNNQGVSDKVDIYDVSKNLWIYDSNEDSRLKEARSGLAAQASNGVILFAGGKLNHGYSKLVDIYNIGTKQWTTSSLSEERTGIASAVSGNYILFAGGLKGDNEYSDAVDIYDTRTNTFTTTLHLSEPRAYATAFSISNRIYVVDGVNQNGPLKKIEIFELN